MKKKTFYFFIVALIMFGSALAYLNVFAIEGGASCPHPSSYYRRTGGCGGSGFHQMKPICCEKVTNQQCGTTYPCQCSTGSLHVCPNPD